MTNSSLENQIDELNRHRTLIKEKWAEKKREISEIFTLEQSIDDESTSKTDRNLPKRRFPSWMGLPTRRGTFFPRERPSRTLLNLLSTLSTREAEREHLNMEMDFLLNRQTAMEKLVSRRFLTTDSIQEYCQYTTRDECPMANPHSSHRRSRSSSTSSNDESQAKRKRSNSFHRKSSRTSNNCGKVHFRRLIKPHTDLSLGDCSFLNTCFHMVS